MTTVNIYLNFNGNCREAFNLYLSVFCGEFPYIGTYGEMPAETGAPPLPDNMKNLIMHISLPISKETVLMGSDTGGEWAPEYKQGNNFSISVNVDSKEDADRIFKALSTGGNVTMPMNETFWQDYFGMLTDKFGINWMVSYPLQKEKSK
jgi:PhnB protein